VTNFFRAENDGQFLGFLGRGDDVLKAPVLVECDPVKETQGGDGDENGTGSQFLFVGQVNLVRPNVLWTQDFG